MKQTMIQFPIRMEKEKLERLRKEARVLDISLNSYLKIKLLTTAEIHHDATAVVSPTNEDVKT